LTAHRNKLFTLSGPIEQQCCSQGFERKQRHDAQESRGDTENNYTKAAGPQTQCSGLLEMFSDFSQIPGTVNAYAPSLLFKEEVSVRKIRFAHLCFTVAVTIVLCNLNHPLIRWFHPISLNHRDWHCLRHSQGLHHLGQS